MDEYLLAEHSELEWSHWWFSGRRIILADILRRWLGDATDLRMLDIGCGAGTMVEVLQSYGTVAGLDTSAKAVAYCRARFPELDFQVGRVPEALPQYQSMDLITAFDVIEHIPDEGPALRSLYASIKPGGLLIATVPAYQWMWSHHDERNHHCRRYTRPGLKASLARAGFEVEWSSYFNTLLFAPAAAVRLGRKTLKRADTTNSDFDITAGNGVLRRIFSAERFAMRKVRLPFGLSIAAVARKRAESAQSGE